MIYLFVVFMIVMVFVLFFLISEWILLSDVPTTTAVYPIPGGRSSRRKAKRLMRKHGMKRVTLNEELGTRKEAFYRGFYRNPVAKRRKRKYYSV